MQNIELNDMNRRDFILTAGAAGLCVVAMTSLPRWAGAADIQAMIAEHVGPGTPVMEKVEINPPEKAETGALVRLPVKVEHPMESGNYVESVSVFVEENPRPFVGKFEFFPESGVVDMEIRIKMAKSSKVHVIARTNSGKLYGVVKKVDVAEGGCAG
ncbi:MAG: thiosulfate oxidation carrier protein SoxY [Magnetococcales bacterium]|nr:thiosulfate oxidation carrier protein SoxY [Magnetococcales bacterium]MBF0322307.1 thiosulfate oxidation carrier protein SoxY [Magnetococcales bacterium]